MLRARLLGIAAVLSALLFVPTSVAAAPHQARAKAPNPAVGVVDVNIGLGYQSASAAGTGMIIRSSGEVLTNNHVIRGATTIRVVDVTTHRRYAATVLGYDIGHDVALLKLTNASKLQTVRLGNSAKVRVGQKVTALGNAGGVGGAPKAAPGKVTAVGRSIVASDGQGNSETLTGLIETNAAVQPGDSGGPLLNAAGRVVGMITAGSAGFRFQGSGGDGYAVPINRALVIARQIEAGKASAEIHVGETAFLGVQISDPRPDAGVAGAVVVSVVAGTPAEAAGLVAGDVITSLDGRAIASAADLQAAVLALTPGTPVAIEWTDQNGGATSGQVTPASGPPQ